MKPCPFCGKQVDLEDHDTLYPTGTGWSVQGGFRTYHSSEEVPPEQRCWGMHCPESAGGCGAEITGHTRQEAIDKWNRRA